MDNIKIYNLDELGIIFKDNRGWIATISEFAIDAGYKIENIHLGSIRPGEIRGNHAHEKETEWMIIFGGKGIFAWKDGEEVKKQEINNDSHYLFKIAPGCPHTIKNIDEHDIYVCAFADQKYDRKKPDRVSVEIIKQ